MDKLKAITMAVTQFGITKRLVDLKNINFTIMLI